LLREIEGWRDNPKDPGRVSCDLANANITSRRMGALGRIKFDVPRNREHE